MIQTKLTEMLGIKYPIIQAGMGPFSTQRLAAAVANAGGLGIISGIGMGVVQLGFKTLFGFKKIPPREAMLEQIDNVKNWTHDAQSIFGVNVPVAAGFQETAGELIGAVIEARKNDPEVASRLKVIITSAGNPAPFIKSIKDSGAFHFQVVPSPDQAKKVESLGTDVVIASGHEGGGHVAHDPVHSMVLLPAVVNSVKIPVVGTGGFCDGASLVAALALGAVGIQMGTRFISTQECEFVPSYKKTIVDLPNVKETLVTRGVFGNLRYLRNETVLRLAEMVRSGAPEKEQLAFEFKSMEAIDSDDVSIAALPGGEVAGRINDIPTVKELMERITQEAEEIIQNRLPQLIAT